MTEQAIEQVAVPVIEAAAKALAPEAEGFLKIAEAHLVAEAERLKAEIDNSHNGLLVWLRNAFESGATAPVDPSPAAPAPQA